MGPQYLEAILMPLGFYSTVLPFDFSIDSHAQVEPNIPFSLVSFAFSHVSMSTHSVIGSLFHLQA